MLYLIRLKDICLRLLPHITYVKSPSVTLPDDVLRLISQYYVDSVLSEAKTVRQLRRRRKEYWSAIAPLAKTSTHLWRIVLDIWRMMWATCCSMSCLSHVQCHGGGLPAGVRILTLSDGWEPGALRLANLRKLEALSIDYHKLLYYDRTSKQLQILPGVNALPSSLRRLEILHFHGPLDDLLLLVKTCCPKLVELRLVQCTMFNNPDCMWWRVHPHDYLVGHRREGVLGYAAALADRIEGLHYLEHVHAHCYLTNSDSIFRHRLDHKRYHPLGHHDRMDPIDGVTMHNLIHFAALTPQDAPPINPSVPRLAEKKVWEVPCSQCKSELENLIEPAERLAASLLSARRKSLKSVSFPSFLSQGRTAPSEWMVEHQ
ncbi:hypothetical protein B0J17DRAFT_713417 [Rhizoctonia solani]|nr:hypothetical protein B0J17DRAFT_713417 [Rhizoctonia solani]